MHGGRMAVTRTAEDERGSHQHRFRRVRMPPNFFAIAFGVAGLAWFALAGRGGLSPRASMTGYVLAVYAALMVLPQLRPALSRILTWPAQGSAPHARDHDGGWCRHQAHPAVGSRHRREAHRHDRHEGDAPV